MIGIILGALVPVVLGGGAFAIFGPSAATAAVGRAAGGIWRGLKGISPRTWLIIIAIAALVAGVIWHQRHAAAALKSEFDRGVATERAANQADMARLRDKAIAIRDRADRVAGGITQHLKDENNATNRSIASRADDQRVRGPGKAAADPRCSNHPGVPGGAGGHGPTVGSAHAAAAGLLASDWHATVPWQWLVDRAEQCDLNRAEALTWRNWHAQQSAAWDAMRAQLQAADPKKGPR